MSYPNPRRSRRAGAVLALIFALIGLSVGPADACPHQATESIAATAPRSDGNLIALGAERANKVCDQQHCHASDTAGKKCEARCDDACPHHKDAAHGAATDDRAAERH